MINQGSEFAMMARMALATMDSEPVAWLLSGGGAKNVVCFDSGNAYADPLREVTPLYRHAQPAPVSYSDFEEFWSSYIHPLAQDDELKGFAWDIWCAAMLQAGNSQVIPDGWTCNDKANAALMMLDRIETVDPVDDDRIDGIKRIVRELAAAPHDTPALNSVQSVDTVADRWIPVSERIPDNTEPVLCIEKRADFGTYGQPFVCWHDGGGWVGKTNYRPIVTHWMPLPAGPQEVR
ncbi:DUF551 domain-containing protein [Klebsiella pneumoniae]|nr:DUF551 domain-containing protein [Klebsiella pneumoniae]MDY7149692.1 DUF551 domain-containing protein [Klebsiella pneumoniae]